MNFAELCQEVVTGTNRPDLLSDITLAVRRATSYVHSLDNWFKDFREKQFDFTATGYQFQIDMRSQMVRFKFLRYIRVYDPLSGTPGQYLKRVEPDNMFDEFKNQKKDVFYVAGSTLNIITSTPTSSLLIGWYVYPDIINYDSWIAEQYPYIIVDHAIGTVKNSIGEVEDANKFIDPQKGIVFTMHLPALRAIALLPSES